MEFLNNNKKKIVWTIVLIVLILGAILLSFGFRIDKKLHINRPATLVISNLDKDATIIIDRKKISSEKIDGNILTLSRLTAGEHEIIVSRKNQWPWTKRFSLEGGSILALAPFTTPQNASGEIIPSSDPEYEMLIGKIRNADINNTITNDTGDFAIKPDINRIVAVWLGDKNKIPKLFCTPTCEPSKIVFTATANVNSVSFFPGRDDVILFAVGQNVFALELDDSGIQNIQPIFSGISPKFILSTSTKTVFIEDQSTLYAVHI